MKKYSQLLMFCVFFIAAQIFIGQILCTAIAQGIQPEFNIEKYDIIESKELSSDIHPKDIIANLGLFKLLTKTEHHLYSIINILSKYILVTVRWYPIILLLYIKNLSELLLKYKISYQVKFFNLIL